MPRVKSNVARLKRKNKIMKLAKGYYGGRGQPWEAAQAALAELRERLKEIPQADEHRLPDLKTELLGRKAGALTRILGLLPTLDPASRKEIGAAANALKREFEVALEVREGALKRAAAAPSGVDLTMPARSAWAGGL